MPRARHNHGAMITLSACVCAARPNVSYASRILSMDLPLHLRTPPHTKVDESVLRRNSRGERYFNAL
jgi:hypothetical protein